MYSLAEVWCQVERPMVLFEAEERSEREEPFSVMEWGNAHIV